MPAVENDFELKCYRCSEWPCLCSDGCTIIHGDCRDVIPLLKPVDCAMTDPPYGVQLGVAPRGDKMMKHGNARYTAIEDTPEFVRQVAVPVVRGLIETSRRVVLTCGTRNMFAYPEPTTIWALHWPNGAGRGRWMAFNCWQPVLCYGAAPRRTGSIPDTFSTCEQAEANGHPCPKPLKLWTKLMEAVTTYHETVLDPFMGSGTTLRAAKDLCRYAIGIEIEERYCAIAARILEKGRPHPFTAVPME